MDDQQDLHFTVSYALWKARKLLPGAGPARDMRDGYRAAASRVIEELRLSRFEVRKRPPVRPPSCGD